MPPSRLFLFLANSFTLLPFSQSFLIAPDRQIQLCFPRFKTHTMPLASPSSIVDFVDDNSQNGANVDTRAFPSDPNSSNTGTGQRIKETPDDIIRVAVLGTGMMGQEHCSYISGFPNLRVDFICDPHQPSLDKAVKIINEFRTNDANSMKEAKDNKFNILKDEDELLARDNKLNILKDEDELLEHAAEIDLLVVASPNYLHTPTLLKWGSHDITILMEKPVAVSREQHDMLRDLESRDDFRARVWVAMEYRFMPAVAKLLQLLPQIGDIKMVTIRENRFPFLHKIGAWNRDPLKTGDSLVEKCVHFFDLFRLITSQEIKSGSVRSLAQRGLNYLNEDLDHHPIVDSAYVVMSFQERDDENEGHEGGYESSGGHHHSTIGCLELCMFSEGSRHQEEIIVTGTKGRVEAYLPENKVYFYERPSSKGWSDRSVPPPQDSIREMIFDCSNVKEVHNIPQDEHMPTHGGYHYSSTAVEWLKLIVALKTWKKTGVWTPDVSLNDGLRAVEMGMMATASIVNDRMHHGNDADYKRSQSCPVHDYM